MEQRIIWVMLNAGVLTFKEFAVSEPLPLATIHEAVLDFLRGRDDAVVFGVWMLTWLSRTWGSANIRLGEGSVWHGREAYRKGAILSRIIVREWSHLDKSKGT
jgi:hypothetical protein